MCVKYSRRIEPQPPAIAQLLYYSKVILKPSIHATVIVISGGLRKSMPNDKLLPYTPRYTGVRLRAGARVASAVQETAEGAIQQQQQQQTFMFLVCLPAIITKYEKIRTMQSPP